MKNKTLFSMVVVFAFFWHFIDQRAALGIFVCVATCKIHDGLEWLWCNWGKKPVKIGPEFDGLQYAVLGRRLDEAKVILSGEGWVPDDSAGLNWKYRGIADGDTITFDYRFNSELRLALEDELVIRAEYA